MGIPKGEIHSHNKFPDHATKTHGKSSGSLDLPFFHPGWQWQIKGYIGIPWIPYTNQHGFLLNKHNTPLVMTSQHPGGRSWGLLIFQHIYINHSEIQIPNQKPQVNSKPKTKRTQKKHHVIWTFFLDNPDATKFTSTQKTNKKQTNQRRLSFPHSIVSNNATYKSQPKRNWWMARSLKRDVISDKPPQNKGNGSKFKMHPGKINILEPKM